ILKPAQRQDGKGAECAILAPINTTPLDIATAAYALTSAAFFRRIAYAIARETLVGKRNIACNWPMAWRDNKDAYNAALLAAIGADPASSLYVDCALGSDPLIDKPEAWLAEQIGKFTGREE